MIQVAAPGTTFVVEIVQPSWRRIVRETVLPSYVEFDLRRMTGGLFAGTLSVKANACSTALGGGWNALVRYRASVEYLPLKEGTSIVATTLLWGGRWLRAAHGPHPRRRPGYGVCRLHAWSTGVEAIFCSLLE